MRFLPIVLAVVATSIASTSAQPQRVEARGVTEGRASDVLHHRRGAHSLGDLFALNGRASTSEKAAAVLASTPERPSRKQPKEESPLQKEEEAKGADPRAAIVIQGGRSFIVHNNTVSRDVTESLAKRNVDDDDDDTEIAVPVRKNKKRATVCTRKTTTKKATTTRATSTKKTTTTKTVKTTAAITSVAPNNGGMIMGGYWPSWSDLAPENIDWDLFDIMSFAFCTATTTGGVSVASWDEPLLKRLVAAGHAGGSKVIVSIGGWDNSQGFSPSVSTAALRSTFASSIKKFIETYDLDGVDLDWEYPNSAFATNYSPSDAANFQTFLQTLRATLGTKMIITAAVSDNTWISSTGGTVKNVSRAAGALSYIMIMNYDVWGGSDNPGPNAPLANLCGNSTQPGASAAAAVQQWGDAGMPKKKMLLGMPYYGYVQYSTKRRLRQRSLGDGSVVFDEEEEEEKRDEREHQRRSLGGKPRRSDDPRLLQERADPLATGQMNFDKLVQNKALKRGTGKNAGLYVAQGDWTKYWDDCSDTPFLANGVQVITYDDTTSLFDKAEFARVSGLGGSSVWSIDGDTNYWNLTRAIRDGMQI